MSKRRSERAVSESESFLTDPLLSPHFKVVDGEVVELVEIDGGRSVVGEKIHLLDAWSF